MVDSMTWTFLRHRNWRSKREKLLTANTAIVSRQRARTTNRTVNNKSYMNERPVKRLA